MNKDTGGPAFPHPSGWRRDPEISDGMSLRDYFAAKAMHAFMTSPTIDIRGIAIAKYAYKMADEMLAERENT